LKSILSKADYAMALRRIKKRYRNNSRLMSLTPVNTG